MFLPDRLRALWNEVDGGLRPWEGASEAQERELAAYREAWRAALLVPGETDLRTSLLREVADYESVSDLALVERQFATAVSRLRDEWLGAVDARKPKTVERFYESPTTIHELMDWHSVRDDTAPLAYVLGLEIARSRAIGSCLDFGSGVGSGAILFARAGISTTLADISTTLLRFAVWRLERRGLPATGIDLKRDRLPREAFDMILAMDVFEHLLDPVAAAEEIAGALRPGGVLFARIHAEEDPDRPQHVARDFGPTYDRLAALGVEETWRDGWLWGHQLFAKRT